MGGGGVLLPASGGQGAAPRTCPARGLKMCSLRCCSFSALLEGAMQAPALPNRGSSGRGGARLCTPPSMPGPSSQWPWDALPSLAQPQSTDQERLSSKPGTRTGATTTFGQGGTGERETIEGKLSSKKVDLARPKKRQASFSKRGYMWLGPSPLAKPG